MREVKLSEEDTEDRSRWREVIAFTTFVRKSRMKKATGLKSLSLFLSVILVEFLLLLVPWITVSYLASNSKKR